MNDNPNLKNIKTLEEEEKEDENKEEPKKTYAYLKESEIIINQIIGKIISLVITDSTKNKIGKQIPSYCFDELKQSIEILTYLDFLAYDKDDLEVKKKIHLNKNKSSTNIKNEDYHLLKEAEKPLNNSEIIRHYKFGKKFDPNILDDCSIDLDVFNDSKYEKKESEKIEKEKDKEEEKITMGFLVREQYEDKKTSFERQEEKKRKIIEDSNKNFNYNFNDDKEKIYKEIYSSENDPFQINSDEKIEIIKKVENHKIDLSPLKIHNSKNLNNKFQKVNIPLDTIIDSTNFWGKIKQPHAPPIDRDAGTKIKYEKPKINLNKKKSNLDNPENNNNNTILEEQNISIKKTYSKKKSKFNFSKKNESENNKSKKKKYVQIEFESTDIDPKNLETYYETSETAELRLKVEQDLKEKKLELEKIAQKEREKQAKLEELEEMRKELSKKNVTVDIKGELVYIKPIDIKALNDEFKKGKSNFKIIKTIETEANYLKNKKNLTIEKNPDMNIYDLKDEKNKKKAKKKRDLFSTKNTSHNAFSSNSKKNEQQKTVFDKNSMRFAAGSNFAIINPEVGVSIIEEKKVKSGGKDFFKKYNKFSLEIFQDQLSKTASSNFFPKITETINVNNTINDKAKRRASMLKQNVIKEIEPKFIDKLPTEDNNILSIKTKNLKIALENLDLISEQKEKEFNKNKKVINKNIIKKTMNKFEQTKYEYNEMNVFAKTLMGSHNWGVEINSERKRDYTHKIPKKPEENELQRELPVNLLKHMPRKRLPPIQNNLRFNTMGQTTSGFFTNRRPKKIKLIVDDNKNNIKKEENNNN